MRGFSTRAAGLLVLLGGLWGGLAPFIGPYWHFTLGPDRTWTWTTGRLWLDVIPGAVAVIAGLMLLRAGPRPHARLGALLGLAAGIWFTVGPALSILWTAGGAQGVGHGSAHARMLENLTFHTGLGVLMAAVAAYILPRFPRALVAEHTARNEGVANRRDRHVAEGALAAGAAGGALEHEHERAREREFADDRTERYGHTGDGRELTDDRTAQFGRTDGGRDGREFADDRTTELGGAGAGSGAARDAGTGAAREEGPRGTVFGDETPASGGDAIADRRQSVRRRRGGLLGMFTRR